MWTKRLLVVCLTLAAFSYTAEAQQPSKLPRLGFLSAGSPSTIVARTQALREGLRELGYMEDKNIVIECRFADGNLIGCLR